MAVEFMHGGWASKTIIAHHEIWVCMEKHSHTDITQTLVLIQY